MKVLVIGKTARVDALAEALAASRHKPLIYACMDTRNPGVFQRASGFHYGRIVESELESILTYARAIKPDFAILADDDVVFMGLGDKLSHFGIPTTGPNREQGRIEWSKSFTRNLLAKYLPEVNPTFRIFSRGEFNAIGPYMEALGEFVVKPDGLTAGKGVRVLGEQLHSIEEALDYCDQVFTQNHPFVIIEERLRGLEFSLQSFCDGSTLRDCPLVQDHKRAQVGDKGPNTGGMGSYSCENHLLPFVTMEEYKVASAANRMIAKAVLEQTGGRYHGIIYGGFMVTGEGVKLIEYNSRWGDPEAMNVMPVLQTDFVDICLATINGTLDKIDVKFDDKATVCKYIVPQGYPGEPLVGQEIDITSLNIGNNVRLYYGAIDWVQGKLYTKTSRALAVVGIGNNLSEAETFCEEAIKKIRGNFYHRPDIGTPEVIKAKVELKARL